MTPSVVFKAELVLPPSAPRSGPLKLSLDLERQVRAQVSQRIFEQVGGALAPKLEALVDSGVLQDYGVSTGGPAGWVTDATLFARVDHRPLGTG